MAVDADAEASLDARAAGGSPGGHGALFVLLASTVSTFGENSEAILPLTSSMLIAASLTKAAGAPPATGLSDRNSSLVGRSASC